MTRNLLLVVALGMAACSQNEPEDVFVVLLDSAPKGLDPRFSTSDSSAKIVGLLHAGLINTDTRDGKPELELAAAIEQPSDTLYKVTLRDDITFHDGSRVTAADVEYTYMELGSDLVKSPYAGMARRIKTFTVSDDTHFTMELRAPHAPFYTDLSMGIVSKAACAGHKECLGDPIGAGPFKFVKQTGADVMLAAFEGYFQGVPKIPKLFFKTVKDDNTRLLALLGGSASLVQNAVAPIMLPVVEDTPKLVVESAASFKYTYIAFNLEHPILKNLKVRQALAHGIDRELIVNYKFKGMARLSTGLLSPAHWAYEGDVERFTFDQERARALLDEAGYPDPEGPEPRFEIEFKVSANKFRKAMAELIAHQLAEIGVKVTVRSYEWGTFYNDVKSRNFAITTLQWPSVLEPSLYRWIFHSSNIPSPDNRAAGANRGAYRNAKVDSLLDAGNRETKIEKRRQIYSEIQKILAHDLPYISLWHEDNVAILKRGTEGYYITPNARFEALKQTQMKAAQ